MLAWELVKKIRDETGIALILNMFMQSLFCFAFFTS